MNLIRPGGARPTRAGEHRCSTAAADRDTLDSGLRTLVSELYQEARLQPVSPLSGAAAGATLGGNYRRPVPRIPNRNPVPTAGERRSRLRVGAQLPALPAKTPRLPAFGMLHNLDLAEVNP